MAVDVFARTLALASLGNGGGGSAVDTYTKAEIDKMFGDAGTVQVEAVDVLPTEDIKENVIYLVPNGSSGNNFYDECMFINGKWETIGTTEIDLSAYATKEELDSKQDVIEGVVATNENLVMDRTNDVSNQMRLKVGDDIVATFPAPPTTFTPNSTFVAKEVKTFYEELGLTPVTVDGYEFGSASDPSGGNINYFTEENGPYLVFTTMDIMEPLNMNGGYVILLKSILPTYLPNPNALTVQFNGTDIDIYDGSSAKTINIKGVTEEQLTQALAQESSARQKQDSLLEEEIAGKIAPSNIKAGDGINVEQSGLDVIISFVALSNYLSKDNTTAYTPTGDYNPATKKYVDDLFNSYIQSINAQLATLTTPDNINPELAELTNVNQLGGE